MTTASLPAKSHRVSAERAARSANSQQEAEYDAELVRRFNAGDESAFVEIMTRYREKIFSVALALLRSELTRLSDAWTTLGAGDERAHDRFARGVAAAEAAIARREREAEEAAEQARQRAEALATRSALRLPGLFDTISQEIASATQSIPKAIPCPGLICPPMPPAGEK